MSYETGKRKIFGDALRDIIDAASFFTKVIRGVPYPAPKAGEFPVCYVSTASETQESLTSGERTSVYRFVCIPFVWDADLGELEDKKIEAVEKVEAQIFKLYTVSEFTDNITMANISNLDYGPLALHTYGLRDIVVLPPLGAVRMDCEATIDYQALE